MHDAAKGSSEDTSSQLGVEKRRQFPVISVRVTVSAMYEYVEFDCAILLKNTATLGPGVVE